jgi:hypothetical protein
MEEAADKSSALREDDINITDAVIKIISVSDASTKKFFSLRLARDPRAYSINLRFNVCP